MWYARTMANGLEWPDGPRGVVAEERRRRRGKEVWNEGCFQVFWGVLCVATLCGWCIVLSEVILMS